MKKAAGLWIAFAMALGCKTAPVAPRAAAEEKPAAVSYPARPAVAAPAFTVFHHDASSVTLVTKEDATDEEIESLLWELRDAAQSHGFDKLKVKQAWVDARDPMIWFHVYRGAKCASEKYASKLPCGASYHAAGDFTYGGFANKERVSGVLLKSEEKEIVLWDADKS